MSRRDLGVLVGVYGAALCGGTLAWLALFHTPLLAEAVFFYRGLAFLGIVAAAVAALLAMAGRGPLRGRLGVRDVLLIMALLVLGNALVFTHLPVTGERSITVFLLANLGAAPEGGSLSADQLAGDVVQAFVVDRGAVQKRLDEQVASGTIVRDGAGYRLTDEGRALLGLYGLSVDIFGYSPANLRPVDGAP